MLISDRMDFSGEIVSIIYDNFKSHTFLENIITPLTNKFNAECSQPNYVD